MKIVSIDPNFNYGKEINRKIKVLQKYTDEMPYISCDNFAWSVGPRCYSAKIKDISNPKLSVLKEKVLYQVKDLTPDVVDEYGRIQHTFDTNDIELLESAIKYFKNESPGTLKKIINQKYKYLSDRGCSLMMYGIPKVDMEFDSYNWYLHVPHYILNNSNSKSLDKVELNNTYNTYLIGNTKSTDGVGDLYDMYNLGYKKLKQLESL